MGRLYSHLGSPTVFVQHNIINEIFLFFIYIFFSLSNIALVSNWRVFILLIFALFMRCNIFYTYIEKQYTHCVHSQKRAFLELDSQTITIKNKIKKLSIGPISQFATHLICFSMVSIRFWFLIILYVFFPLHWVSFFFITPLFHPQYWKFISMHWADKFHSYCCSIGSNRIFSA